MHSEYIPISLHNLQIAPTCVQAAMPAVLKCIAAARSLVRLHTEPLDPTRNKKLLGAPGLTTRKSTSNFFEYLNVFPSLGL